MAATSSKRTGLALEAEDSRTPGTGNKPRRSRDTVASLRGDLDAVVARLKQADRLTQQSITSLVNAYGILERRVSEENSVNKAALTKRVDQLSSKLTQLIRETQRAVSTDLRAALSNPTIENLRIAVERTNTRVTAVETSQGLALSKVNQHIATLAKAVDARISDETRAREAAIQSFKNDIERTKNLIDSRINEVENASAKAIVRLGENMVAVSKDFQVRADINSQAISDKVSDIAIKTQRDFEDYRTKIERRLESIEENQRNLDSYTDRTLNNIGARIDSLEYGLSSVSPAQTALTASIPEPAPRPTPPEMGPASSIPHSNGTRIPSPVPSPPSFLDTIAADPVPTVTALQDNVYDASHLSVVTTSDAPAPFAPTAPDPYAPTMPDPYARGTGTDGAAPLPFVPSEHGNMVNQGPPSLMSAVPQTSESQRHLYLNAEPASTDQYVDADLPYADPAYAEAGSDVNMTRPGSFKAKPKTAPKLPGGTGRNLRVAGMAVAVAAIGYFALRGFVGPSNPGLETAGNESMFLNEPEGITPVGSNPAAAITENSSGLETTETIGEYADNQGVDPNASSAAPNSLEAAAEEGDSIAQFQYGLSLLQNGNMKDGVNMIRASANQGQPAAQYRLAKLYELGEGVTADATMARRLAERAAQAGNRIAMHDLALYYAEGRGDVDVNIETAASWFEKAAQRGVVDSQFNLGILYESGQGLPKDFTNAYVWYSIAAKQGDPYARERVELLRDQIPAENLERADERVADFVPTRIDEEANGIFRSVSWTLPEARQEANVSSAVNQIQTAQTLLGQLGYNAGTPDGAMGPQTRSAIIRFQRDKGLDPTGQVNNTLLSELQRAADA